MALSDDISKISTYLQQNGFKIEHGCCPPGSSSKVDVKATKGRFLGVKLLWINIASNPSDAAIASWNLKSITNGRKIVYLADGSPIEVQTGDDSIVVVTKVDEIPVN